MVLPLSQVHIPTRMPIGPGKCSQKGSYPVSHVTWEFAHELFLPKQSKAAAAAEI
jgi:hypothetical protein